MVLNTWTDKMKTKLSEESNIFWSLKYKVTHTHIYVYKIFHRIHLPIISIFNLPWYGGPCITTVWKAKSSTALSMGAWFINLKFRICFKLDEREILINIVNYYHLTFYLMCSSIPACDLSELEGLDMSQKKWLKKQGPSASIIIVLCNWYPFQAMFTRNLNLITYYVHN